MAISPMKQALDAELCDLWSRRADLDATGMTRLCEIVMDVLMSLRPKELASLSEDNEVYVIGFIENKVLRPDLLSQCYHTGALCGFYKHYLIDEIRREKRRTGKEIADRQDNSEGEETSHIEQTAEDATHGIDPLQILEDAGFSCPKIATAARKWLESTEDWARMFVAYSNCPDAEQSEPLFRLAERLGIKSQAYKAEKLGFNWGKKTHAGFEKTLLGLWIVSLGIDIRPENADLVLGALKILCFEALSWAELQGPAT